MTVTPKIDPRKDRKPVKKAPRMAAIYSLWMIAALGAVSAAGSVYIWRDGRAPVQPAVAIAPAPPQVVVNPQSEREINRLNDAVRVLASERDRLATRLEQLERSVGDITASIPQKKAPPVAKDEPLPPPAAPPVQVVSPPNPEPRPQGPNQLMPPQAPQMNTTVIPATPPIASNDSNPPPNPDSATTRTEFGVDLGGEKTVDGLRARWATLRGNHGTALDGLRPLISVKEGTKAGTVELRLVAGPVANAAAAARICARLQTNGVPCIPTVFDGQRLSLR
jgi:hypothetical protein